MKRNEFFNRTEERTLQYLKRWGRLANQVETVSQNLFRRGNEYFQTGKNNLLDYLRIHRGKVVLIMFLTLLLGTIGAVLRRASVRENEDRISGEAVLRKTKEVAKRVAEPIISGVSKQTDVLLLESQLSHILTKDSLTQEDSVFLQQLDEYLNGVSQYRGLPTGDSSNSE